jgi:hypothetical protein
MSIPRCGCQPCAGTRVRAIRHVRVCVCVYVCVCVLCVCVCLCVCVLVAGSSTRSPPCTCQGPSPYQPRRSAQTGHTSERGPPPPRRSQRGRAASPRSPSCNARPQCVTPLNFAAHRRNAEDPIGTRQQGSSATRESSESCSGALVAGHCWSSDTQHDYCACSPTHGGRASGADSPACRVGDLRAPDSHDPHKFCSHDGT